MSLARIAYRIIDVHGPGKHGVTMNREKAKEYRLAGYEIQTRIRWCFSNGRWHYGRKGWKKHPKGFQCQ